MAKRKTGPPARRARLRCNDCGGTSFWDLGAMKVFPVGGMPDLKAQMVIRVCVTCLLRKAGGDAALAAPQKRLRARK